MSSHLENAKKERMGSPLNFEWGDEQFIDPKAKLDDLDPFLEGNDGSLASEDQLEISSGPKIIGMPTGDIPRPGTIALDSRKRSVSSTISNQSDGISTITRRKKKPKGMPKRPLSAYNLYFQSERAKILAAAEGEGEKIGFEGLGKIIGKKWRNLSETDLRLYEKLAEKDSVRYRKEMEAYNENKTKKAEEEKKVASPRVPSTAADASDSFASRPFGSMAPQPANLAQANTFPPTANTQTLPTGTREEFLRLHAMTTANQAVGHVPLPHHNFTRSQVEVNTQGGYPAQYDTNVQSGAPLQHVGVPSQVSPSPATPLSSSGVEAGLPQNSFPMPPDMEIVLSDRNGKDRKYRVQYTCYAMTRDAAHKFIDGLMGPQSNESRPPQRMGSAYHQVQPQLNSNGMACMNQTVNTPTVNHHYGPPQLTMQLPPGYIPVSQVPTYPGTPWTSY